MLNAIEHGKIERLERVRTIADGIAVKEPGVHTFDFCQQYVDEIVSVTEDEISTAILALIEQHKLIAEGAGAVSVAAAMFEKVPIQGKKTLCVVSGGNIDVTILSRVIGRGLQKSGRSCVMTIELVDKPGQTGCNPPFAIPEIIATACSSAIPISMCCLPANFRLSAVKPPAVGVPAVTAIRVLSCFISPSIQSENNVP